MYELFAAAYVGSGPGEFESDLADKHWVIRIFSRTGALEGFSTVRLEPDRVLGRDLCFLFSGDTVMAREARGGSALAGAFTHVMRRVLGDAGGSQVWWMLLSKGHRTYRYLPLYFRRWHPMPGRAADALESALLERFCSRRYGQAWKSDRGLVVFDPPRERMNDREAAIAPARLNDPAIRFFLERNPGFASGDELACLAEVSEDNLRPACGKAQRALDMAWGV